MKVLVWGIVALAMMVPGLVMSLVSKDWAFFWIGIVIAAVFVPVALVRSYFQRTPEQRAVSEAIEAHIRYPDAKPAVICPHCQTKGNVRVRAFGAKTGISGAKATSAVLTSGLSLLAVGLSRKESKTEAYCTNCQMNWLI